MRRKHHSERDQLELFRALPGDLAPRDAQDLMAYPFFSLAKTKRIVPIDFRAGAIAIRVEAVPEHGMATIWDADVLIWAASQIVEARDAGLQFGGLGVGQQFGKERDECIGGDVALGQVLGDRERIPDDRVAVVQCRHEARRREAAVRRIAAAPDELDADLAERSARELRDEPAAQRPGRVVLVAEVESEHRASEDRDQRSEVSRAGDPGGRATGICHLTPDS